jgi:biopolymer transport protein TolR
MDEQEDGVLQLSPKKKMDDEIDITPMIDCVFLLLIFFIVAARPDSQQASKLAEARNGIGVMSKDAIVLNIKSTGKDSASFYARDRVFNNAPGEMENELIEYLTKELQDGEKEIIVRAEQDIRFGQLTRVRRAVGDADRDRKSLNLAIREGK